MSFDLANLPDEPAALIRLAAKALREGPLGQLPDGQHFCDTLEQAAEVVEHGEPEPEPDPPRGGHWNETGGVWVSYYQGDRSGITPHACELDALRVAVAQDGRGDQVLFVRWGQSVTQADDLRTAAVMARMEGS